MTAIEAGEAEELRRVVAELEAFTELAAHELQEPVRKLQMFGDLLRPGSGATPEERAEYVGRMQDAARRMGRLVADLRTLSRVRAERRPFSEVALGPVVAEAADGFAAAAARDGGALEVGPLPAVAGDREQLRLLFANLLSNAVKFRRAGVPLRASVSGRTGPGGSVEVDVSDNGIGFDMAHASRIFEPFQRLHRRTDYEGSGLGLALCARIAARHGGAVRARSTPGEGSVFTVSLPAGQGG